MKSRRELFKAVAGKTVESNASTGKKRPIGRIAKRQPEFDGIPCAGAKASKRSPSYRKIPSSVLTQMKPMRSW